MIFWSFPFPLNEYIHGICETVLLLKVCMECRLVGFFSAFAFSPSSPSPHTYNFDQQLSGNIFKNQPQLNFSHNFPYILVNKLFLINVDWVHSFRVTFVYFFLSLFYFWNKMLLCTQTITTLKWKNRWNSSWNFLQLFLKTLGSEFP